LAARQGRSAGFGRTRMATDSTSGLSAFRLMGAVSRKREYFKYLPETVGDFAPKAGQFRNPETDSQFARARYWRAFLRSLRAKSPCPMTGWLAGDAVLIAPVSKQIPRYQGILQGILRFWGLETGFSTKKPLRCSHFSSNSLRRLSGKTF
jgi:hypothetical protein